MIGIFKRPARVSLGHILPDSVIIIASLYLSLYLRLGISEIPEHIVTFHQYLPIILAIRLSVNWVFGVYEIMWRYISARDAITLAKATVTSSAIVITISFFIFDRLGQMPRTIYIIDFLLVTIGLLGIRIHRRIRYEARGQKAKGGQRTLIFGAGTQGRTLASRFVSDPGAQIELVGFIDDDPQKIGIKIEGRPVLGTIEDLEEILKDKQIEQVVMAFDGLGGEVLRRILQICYSHGIRPKLLTSLRASAQAPAVELYREVSLNDLLNRASHEMDLESISGLIKNKCILVTGAGGSIGSEIARQVFSHNPQKLLLMDNSEFNLFNIDKDLRLLSNSVSKIYPLLADIKDERTVEQIIATHKPQIVFHAAAYKHVHLVEDNPNSSILNNIWGTLALVRQAQRQGVETLVMISTDKAVNPVGIMGATKRVCELIVTAAALESGKRFCSVRFGNVLGSSGSLIPTLQQQIREGGPVTITHKDMTRFFMLIPEAVSLVLKASTIARPGDINVLKMGEPVKILDIARSLMTLMGVNEEKVPIVFTGLRPGEKLFEELYIRGDELKSEHPDILILPNGDSHLQNGSEESKKLMSAVEANIKLASDGAQEVVNHLHELVKKYSSPHTKKAKPMEKVFH
ncbi:MAG: nucleoside-diphosphate sugar epimerase/dehydratase [Pseudomonadota bacterium]|nr:nucleoside-diphosphate sugar epimerase/dehydratase [Pseudomonadota bacterium]